MLNQVLTLSRLQLCNLFGLNVLRHTKDSKQKRNFLLMSLVCLFVAAVAAVYIGALVVGYHLLGLGEAAPMILYTLLCIILLIFSIFKAGSILFSMKTYDIMISLPVRKSAILFSRFVTMYLSDLLLSLLVMVPGLAVHIYFAKPELGFYLISLPVILFAPLLPLTLASIFGALIKAVSSKMKRKSLAETLLTLLFVAAVFVGSFVFGKQSETLTEEMLTHLLDLLTNKLGAMFPPALWYYRALQGDLFSFFLLLAVPAFIFLVFLWLLCQKFQEICSGLNASYAKQNFRLSTLRSEHTLTALIKRESKLYFSSSLYVTNTIIGYLMALILAIAVFAAGPDKLLEMFGVTQTGTAISAAEISSFAVALIPFIFSFLLCITSITACSISMEGKCFWQLQVLPVKANAIYKSKILWSLLIAAPFTLISVILLILAAKPNGMYGIHYVLLPCSFLIFSVILGLCANLLFHRFDWDNEAKVVKQGASVLITMVGSILVLLVSTGAGIALLTKKIRSDLTLYCFLLEFFLLLISAVLYHWASKKELLDL